MPVVMQVHGSQEASEAFALFPNVVLKHLRKAMNTAGESMVEQSVSKLHQFQQKQWLLEEAITSKVQTIKKEGLVRLKFGFDKKISGDKFSPYQYGWKIDWGNMQVYKSVKKQGSDEWVWSKKRARYELVKTEGEYRAPRPYMLPVMEENKEKIQSAVYQAFEDAVQEVQKKLDSAARKAK
jgi:hypothetical protein